MESSGRLSADKPRSTWLQAIGRGFAGACPHCGRGRVFAGFLTVADTCEQCGLELHRHRADDLPPYLVIFVVGHAVGYGILVSELRFEAPMWLHLALWPPLALALSLALLRPVKGAVVGLQFALGLHGFDPPVREPSLHDRG